MTRAEELAEKVNAAIAIRVPRYGGSITADARAALSELVALAGENNGRYYRKWARAQAGAEALAEALGEVVKQFNLWSEDANDGTYAYYKSDGLMVACVNARNVLARHRGEK